MKTESGNAEPCCKVGLTGGIGSGKSTVAAMLAQLGAFVVDADAVSRSTTAPGGAALAAIAQTFGAHMLDGQGALDRQAMRELVFQNPQARIELQAIIHPLVIAQLHSLAQKAQEEGARVLVYDVPLLIEGLKHWREHLSLIVVIDCPRQTQIARVMARSGLPEHQVLDIIAAQATREQRLAAADVVIDNGPEVSLEELASQVQRLFERCKPRYDGVHFDRSPSSNY